MGTTGAVLYVRPWSYMITLSQRRTASSMLVPFRVVSGLYTQGGVNASADLANLTSWLPSAQQAFGWVTVNGQRLRVEPDPVWYRFLNFVATIKLGGPGGATIPDVVAAVESSQAQTSAVVSRVDAVADQSQTNAEALKATIDVVEDAGLPGSTNIPDVRVNRDYGP